MLTLKTTNISSFRLIKDFKGYHKVIIDQDSKFSNLEKIHIATKGGVTFTLDKKSKKWKLLEQIKSTERNVSNYGPLHRMYESRTALALIIPRKKEYYEHVALQIAHDWYLYGRGDSIILYDDDPLATTACSAPTNCSSCYYKIYLGVISENKLMDKIVSEKPCGIELDAATGIKVGGENHYKDPGTGKFLIYGCKLFLLTII